MIVFSSVVNSYFFLLTTFEGGTKYNLMIKHDIEETQHSPKLITIIETDSFLIKSKPVFKGFFF